VITAAWSFWYDSLFPLTNELTDRVQGFNISQQVGFGRQRTMSAILELDNDDGALTPAEGGGTGTYANVDWFTQPLYIYCEFTGAVGTEGATVFQGIIQSFQLIDNGTESTVQLVAYDGYSIAGAVPPDAVSISVTATGNIEDMFDELGTTINTFQPFPLLDPGSTTVAQVVNRLDASKGPDGDYSIGNTITGTILDVISNNILPSGPAVSWPGLISTSGTTDQYEIYVIDRGLNRDATNRITYSFDEGPGDPTVTGSDIIFNRVDVAYNENDLYNYAKVTSGSVGSVTATEQNTDSINKYGMRAVNAGKTLNRTNTDAGYSAGSWANRYSEHRYAPRRLSFSSATINAHGPKGSESNLADLYDLRYGLWQPCTVTWTPTGGSNTTRNCLITGRDITGTTTDQTITIYLEPLEDFSSFELNSSTLGVLNTNRLG